MIREEIAGVRGEIGQAREVLVDAVGKLIAGFGGVSSAIHQSGATPQALAMVDREISGIVTALQFQDLLDQILGHALRRLDAIDSGLGDGHGSGGTASQGRSVAQRHVNPGDVELF